MNKLFPIKSKQEIINEAKGAEEWLDLMEHQKIVNKLFRKNPSLDIGILFNEADKIQNKLKNKPKN